MEDDSRYREEASTSDSSDRRTLDTAFLDYARRALVSSVRTLLASEEGLKALVGAIIPKEVGQAVMREIAGLRSEVIKAVVSELAKFLERIDPAAEVQKVLSGLEFEIHLNIKVSPKTTAPQEGEGDKGSKGKKNRKVSSRVKK